jgi:hypothetical protein
MTIKEQLSREIESTPEALLVEVLDFLCFIKSRQNLTVGSPQTSSTPHFSSTGQSLMEHLKTIGTWQGDDLEECLQSVYTTRSQAKFDNVKPFES